MPDFLGDEVDLSSNVDEMNLKPEAYIITTAKVEQHSEQNAKASTAPASTTTSAGAFAFDTNRGSYPSFRNSSVDVERTAIVCQQRSLVVSTTSFHCAMSVSRGIPCYKGGYDIILSLPRSMPGRVCYNAKSRCSEKRDIHSRY